MLSPRLAKAAPELLEALKELLSADAQLAHEMFRPYPSSDWREHEATVRSISDRLHAARERARAAVRAAEDVTGAPCFTEVDISDLDVVDFSEPSQIRLHAVSLLEAAVRIAGKNEDGRRDDSVLWRIEEAVVELRKLEGKDASFSIARSQAEHEAFSMKIAECAYSAAKAAAKGGPLKVADAVFEAVKRAALGSVSC